MDIININGKQYDPYFILDVTKQDSDEHITKAFKLKAKKYHPDKARDDVKRKKYETYFKILVESLDYIKKKRKNSSHNKLRDKSHVKDNNIKKQMDKNELSTFNEKFNKKHNINDHGYGEKTRLSKISEYENLNVDTINLFDNKKFSNDKFNLMFDYNKKLQEEHLSNEKLALIHKTTDGFYGYNTADIQNCSLVSSFNGLLITGDDLGESGVGYWNNNYGDYLQSYQLAKNPKKIIKVPKEFIEQNIKEKREIKKSYHKNDIQIKTKMDYKEEEKKLYNNQYNDLLEKEKKDKEIVLKFSHYYDDNTLKMALDNQLDKSPSYIQTFDSKLLK